MYLGQNRGICFLPEYFVLFPIIFLGKTMNNVYLKLRILSGSLSSERVFKIITPLLLSLLITFSLNAQYTLLYTKFKNHLIFTAASWDTTLYVAAGLSPELMVSRDGWKTMSYKPYDFQVGNEFQSIRKIQLTSPSTIFLKGQQNHYVSRDTGNTWTVLPGSNTSRMVFSSLREGIYFSQGKVHFTLDSGNTWTEKNMPTNSSGYVAIAIFPNGNMTARNGNNLLTSTDTGATWSSQILPRSNIDDIAVLWSNSSAFYSPGNAVYQTTNSGVTWSQIHTSTDVIRIFHMTSPDSVYVFCPANLQLRLYRNYFSSFELLHQFSAGARLDDLSFASLSKVIAVTYGDSLDQLSVSNDGGHTFVPAEPNYIDQIYSLKFFNSLEGQLIYDAPLKTYFTSTSDGGLTWSAKVPIETFNGFSSNIYPESRNSVLLINTQEKKILRFTPEMGYTTIFKTNSPQFLYKYGDSTIFVVSDSIYWGTSTASNLWKSTNNGLTWELVNHYDNDYYLNSIYMHNDSTGFGILNGNVIRITQGGRGWQGIQMFQEPTLSEAPSFYRVVRSFNDSTVVVTLSRSIHRTTNSGKNWQSRLFSDATAINDAVFVSPDTGYVALGTAGPSPLRVTTNGGITWMRSFWESVYIPEYLSAFENNKIFLATDFDIFYTDNFGGQPLGLKEDIELVHNPSEFELSQNWPNPFNPSTNISYYLPESGIVKSTVYNIMGELVNSQQPEFVASGHHTIKFDGSNLPSGVYILNVNFAGQRRSIKMLLLK